MKKIGSKGFTLIELLAVITIMGILMMVAIPSVSRTIENARRDTYANIAHEYLNAIRNNVLADNIECEICSGLVTASALTDGFYYFEIDTTQQQTKDLMESGGKSPFGNAEMKGYVVWHKYTDNYGMDNQKTITKYYIKLVDSGRHGFDVFLSEDAIKRANIFTSTTYGTDDIEPPTQWETLDASLPYDDQPYVYSQPFECILS